LLLFYFRGTFSSPYFEPDVGIVDLVQTRNKEGEQVGKEYHSKRASKKAMASKQASNKESL